MMVNILLSVRSFNNSKINIDRINLMYNFTILNKHILYYYFLLNLYVLCLLI